MEVSVVTIGAQRQGISSSVPRAEPRSRGGEGPRLRDVEKHGADDPQRSTKVLIGDARPKNIIKHRSYFEQKQPVNKIASRVMGKFFKRILDEEPPEAREGGVGEDGAGRRGDGADQDPSRSGRDARRGPCQTPQRRPTPEKTRRSRPSPQRPWQEPRPHPRINPPGSGSPGARTESLRSDPPLRPAGYAGPHGPHLHGRCRGSPAAGIPLKEVDTLIDGLNGAVSQSISSHIPMETTESRGRPSRPTWPSDTPRPRPTSSATPSCRSSPARERRDRHHQERSRLHERGAVPHLPLEGRRGLRRPGQGGHRRRHRRTSNASTTSTASEAQRHRRAILRVRPSRSTRTSAATGRSPRRSSGASTSAARASPKPTAGHRGGGRVHRKTLRPRDPRHVARNGHHRWLPRPAAVLRPCSTRTSPGSRTSASSPRSSR